MEADKKLDFSDKYRFAGYDSRIIRAKYSKYLLAAWLLSLANLQSGRCAELHAVIDQVQKHYEQVQSLEADFIQTAINKMFGRKATSRGKLYIKRPGLMRWDYSGPTEQLFIVDGRKFWWYTPKSRQVIVKSAGKLFGSNLPLAFIMGGKKLTDDFNIGRLGKREKNSGYRLELAPKDPIPNLKKLVLEIEAGSFRISELVMFDAYDNRTSVVLENYRENTPLPDELFHFDVPPGVRVITEEDLYLKPND